MNRRLLSSAALQQNDRRTGRDAIGRGDAIARGEAVRLSAFAEYLALPTTNVWVHDPSIPRDVQSIFDPFGNAVHTALQFDVLGEDVLITGAGPIGIMATKVIPPIVKPIATVTIISSSDNPRCLFDFI